jgi:3-oxoacyl-[acyl-carrier-protein] synthase-3
MSEEYHPSGRSRLRSLKGVQILATGGYVPDTVVTNADLVERVGVDSDWIVQRTGILERRHLPPHLATSDMAYEAGRQCLERAGVSAKDVDLVIVGTFTSDYPVPAAACQIQHRLGITAPAFDVQAACAGFMYSLVTGMQYVAAGTARRALVIGADTNSRAVDPSDQRMYPLFGDGAGAVLLAPGEPEQGLEAFTLGADGSGAELLVRPAGGSKNPMSCGAIEQKQQYLRMDGRAVFKWAVRLLNDTIHDVLDFAHLGVADVDLVILHQANIRIIEASVADLGVDRARVCVNIDRFGNTSAGSIPLALNEAVQMGRVKRGNRLLLAGFGAGLAWGTALLRW